MGDSTYPALALDWSSHPIYLYTCVTLLMRDNGGPVYLSPSEFISNCMRSLVMRNRQNFSMPYTLFEDNGIESVPSHFTTDVRSEFKYRRSNRSAQDRLLTETYVLHSNLGKYNQYKDSQTCQLCKTVSGTREHFLPDNVEYLAKL